jgi:poly-gamma-glutamate synthesis protein (capsule biosynthesis protein)
VPYGLSGDPALVADLTRQLAWPTSNYDPDKMTVVLMTGVTALTRATAWRMNGKGVEYPGLLIGDWMRDADFTHVSHEVAFSPSCPIADPSPPSLRFCADPDHIQLFEELQVDLIELTGNHVMDWKEAALLFSLDLYEQKGMKTFGGGRNLEDSLHPVLIEHNGNRIAWFGCNAAGPAFSWAKIDRPGSTPCTDERVLSQVRSLVEQGYLPIFTFQWGESESKKPLPLQIEAFQEAASAGAVIVQGSQAHRPQTIEFHEGSFIHYGLGNLFFDQMQTWPNRQEFLDRHIFYDGRYISTELLTAILEDYAQPRPTTLEERDALLAEIFQASGW